MDCEMCGKKKATARAIVEGIVVPVCEDCTRFGKRLAEPPKLIKEKGLEIEEVTINPNFATVIRVRREALKMKVDELAKKVNEKASVMKRLEQGRMRPTVKTAKKLEKALDIKLIVHEEDGIK